MDDALLLLDQRKALGFLQGFPSDVRRRGEMLYRQGCVEALVDENKGARFVARVIDRSTCRVELYLDEDTGWGSFCTCDKRVLCAHAVAVMNAVLAERRTVLVRKLSAGAGGLTTLESLRPRPDPSQVSPLAEPLIAALGRPLDHNERDFLRNLHQLYLRSSRLGSLSLWDLQALGLPRLTTNSWGTLEIWPEFPENEHQFWGYIANACQEQGCSIPEFMRPISALDAIQKRLSIWRRARDIERWSLALNQLETQNAYSPARPGKTGQADLRLKFVDHGLQLEWQPHDRAEFEPLKSSRLRQLSTDHERGAVRLSLEAELLWPFFAERLSLGMPGSWNFLDPTFSRNLGRLLRLPMLESRIVDAQGQPLARPAEPLRWELTPAGSEAEDYRFDLVQADGRPVPPIYAAFSGNPTLYLTANAVFTGPAPQPLLTPGKEVRIPAPAIERVAGITFLQAVGVELPPRLRERIRTLSYKIAIQCELHQYPGRGGDKRTEDCEFMVRAEAPDGHQQTWLGRGWVDTTPPGIRPPAKDSSTLTVYDTQALAALPPLMAPLNLKPAGLSLATRVTRKFPELFATWLKSLPPDIDVHLGGELASLAGAEVSGRVRLEVSEADIDWFDLRVVLEVGDTTLTPEEIKLLLNAKGGYVRLEGKGWRRLQYDLSEEENDRLARLGLSPRELSAEPQRLHALQLADEAARKFLPEQQVEQIQRRAGELKARVAPELPAGVTAEMRPYQVEGFHFLAYLSTNRFGGILADDMGLGKTLQTLAWLLWLRASLAQPPPSLVVCPKSVMDNWHAEAARFTPGLRVRAWSPGELERLPEELGSADVHVLNYSQLRSLGESLVPTRWLAVILDEGQYIKNPSSQTAQVARALRADHRLVLSGTPIENRLLDLWSLMSFAMPGVLGSRPQFARIYDAKGDPFARRRLSSRVRPFVLRRTKTQVAKDLPDRIEEDLFCEIEGEQQTLYRAELKRAQQLLLRIQTQKELAQFQFHFLTSLLRLRQICCHPRLMKPDSKAPSAKTEALLEQLEPLIEEGQKVLVFSQFVEMLNLLQPELEQRGWPHYYLAGHTEDRGALVKSFQDAPGAAVFLISLKAGGFGLNLTAASYVVLFDPWWNPAVENQAIDRTHRIGQTRNVIAYRLLIKNSIEEKIRELQKKKKALAEDVLGEEKFAQNLSLDDLHFLLAD